MRRKTLSTQTFILLGFVAVGYVIFFGLPSSLDPLEPSVARSCDYSNIVTVKFIGEGYYDVDGISKSLAKHGDEIQIGQRSTISLYDEYGKHVVDDVSMACKQYIEIKLKGIKKESEEINESPIETDVEELLNEASISDFDGMLGI